MMQQLPVYLKKQDVRVLSEDTLRWSEFRETALDETVEVGSPFHIAMWRSP
jgi:hypothetical protein